MVIQFTIGNFLSFKEQSTLVLYMGDLFIQNFCYINDFVIGRIVKELI